MSHECPECDELCYCRGDVDDCLLNTKKAILSCVHWKKCERDYSDEDEFDDRDGTDEPEDL